MSPETVAAVLLAAAPAALAVLPLSWWFVRARSRRDGITWSSRTALDLARRVDVVLLDRWGTVTTGELKVAAVEPFDPDNERSLRWFAGALGHAAEDPVTRAVARLSSRGKVTEVEQYDGRGISGSVDRHPVRLGRPDWLGMAERDGVGVTVGVQVDSRPIGYITVSDDVRPDAATHVERLRGLGVEPVLVSEDSERNTRHLAEACAVERWHGELPPGDRAALVERLRAEGRRVALAGPPSTTSADLVLSADPAARAGVRLDDLDVRRIATARLLSRGSARAGARSRGFGLAAGVVGAGIAVLGWLPVAAALAWSVLGCVVVLALAMRS